MSITDKTRKLLWGRSGSHCAICRKPLIMDSTDFDNDSVVGDECHIVSKKKGGPRYYADFPPKDLDEISNLILLCKTHHKMVDDQADTYDEELLRKLKLNHEEWVSNKLSEKEKQFEPVNFKIKRIKENIPKYLKRISNGQELFDIAINASAASYGNDELMNEPEVRLISAFFQAVQDWVDLGFDEIALRIEAEYELTQEIKELEEAGFWVFGARELQVLKEENGEDVSWPVAHFSIIRQESPEIIKLKPT